MRMLGRRQHREGDPLGGGGPSAQRPEGGCPALYPSFIRCRPSSCSFFGLAIQVQISHRRSHLLREVHLVSYSCLSAAIDSSSPLFISQCGQLCTLYRLLDGPLLLRFRIGRLGKHMLHPAFHTRWA